MSVPTEYACVIRNSSAKQCNLLSHARPAPFPFPLFLFRGWPPLSSTSSRYKGEGQGMSICFGSKQRGYSMMVSQEGGRGLGSRPILLLTVYTWQVSRRHASTLSVAKEDNVLRVLLFIWTDKNYGCNNECPQKTYIII